jgi:CRISPR-associated endonuclease/helicase Cas3
VSTSSAFIAHYRETDKVTQSLAAHLWAVAAQASCFAEKIGLARQGELIGLLHDLGKYSDEFQAYLKSAVGLLNQDDDEEFVDAKGLKGKVDHSTAGAQVVWTELAKRGQLGEIVGKALALCLSSHHSGLIDCLTSDVRSFGEDGFARRMNKAVERTHRTEVVAKVDEAILSRIRDLLSDPGMLATFQEAIANILRNAPGKNDRGFVAQQQVGLLVRVLFSCLIDADRIDTADFEKPGGERLRTKGRYAEWDVLISRLEDHLEGLRSELAIDHLRQDISRHCLEGASRATGIYSLTVPTGGGKTLASLRFGLHHARAHGLDRVIYFIPFTSIIDQNANVARHILEHPGTEAGSVVLEHHSNLTPDEESWRAKILAENWDAPVVFTTNVQFLETLFGAGTGRNRRPPRDAMNAFLSFLYTLLLHDARSALEAAGLDSQVGFLHRDRPGRPSLALDLMEEFRAFLCDRLVLSLVNRSQIDPNAFETSPVGGVALNDAARKTVLGAYQKRKLEEMIHPFIGEKVSVGLMVHLQARLLARFLRGDVDAYPAFLWK